MDFEFLPVFFVCVIVGGTCFSSLEMICQTDGVDGQEKFTFQLNYDENAATADLTIHSKYFREFKFFKMYLFAKWEEGNVDESACSDDDHFLLLHTIQEIPSTDYELFVRLNHIYSGLYRLSIIPWINKTTSLSSETAHFLTRTLHTPIAIDNWTTHFTIHVIPQISAIIVQFIPAEDEYEFFHYEILLSSCHEVSSTSFFDEHSLICYTNRTKPECTFNSVKPGRYCAFIRPIDIRCNFGYVWQVKDNCIVHSDAIELGPMNIQQSPEEMVLLRTSESAYLGTILGIVLTTLLIITVILAMLIYRNVLAKKKAECAEAEKFPALHNLDHFETKQKNEKTVLILWMQEEEDLDHEIAELKSTLTTNCNAKILDIYDEDLYDEISIDPVRWLNSIMSIRDLRIVVVGSTSLEYHYSEALLGVDIRTPGSLESLVLYALQLIWLRKIANHSLNSNTFYVRFSNNWNDNHLGELTPFRCFLLPVHLSELIYHLNS